MDIFTSITFNYLPKALILARSIKKFHPDWAFHLFISDKFRKSIDLPKELLLKKTNFDQVIWIDDLKLPNLNSWIFKHNIVELCTAVKGLYLQQLKNNGAKKVLYIDPDIVIFNDLDEISRILDQHAIALIPHLLEYTDDPQSIMDNEIMSTLRHGTFNLGFLGINCEKEDAKSFVDWWAKRCLDYCYADFEKGLFTDQKWCDLVPSFFEDHYIIRDPGYDVASWNLDKRYLSVSENGNIMINEKYPLRFYHFTGYDSGAGSVMTGRYSRGNPIVKELWDWYERELNDNGQPDWGGVKCFYDFYENGVEIPKAARVLYRNRQDLIRAFPDPFKVDDQGGYWGWKGK